MQKKLPGDRRVHPQVLGDGRLHVAHGGDGVVVDGPAQSRLYKSDILLTLFCTVFREISVNWEST